MNNAVYDRKPPKKCHKSFPEISKVLRPEPAHSVIGSPKFTGLVNVDFTGLLSVGFSEFLVDVQCPDASLEYAPLATEVGSARETKSGCEGDFSRVQQMTIRVIAQVQHLALPVCLQTFRVPP